MLTVWERPERWSGYVLGVDTAEGLGHGDYSCVQVIDVKEGEQVAIWHGRIPPGELAMRFATSKYGKGMPCAVWSRTTPILRLLRNSASWAIRTSTVSGP